jgi:hypothetical protein
MDAANAWDVRAKERISVGYVTSARVVVNAIDVRYVHLTRAMVKRRNSERGYITL